MVKPAARTGYEVILHVVTETACHAGRLDAAQKLLDGKQWLVIEPPPPVR